MITPTTPNTIKKKSSFCLTLTGPLFENAKTRPSRARVGEFFFGRLRFVGAVFLTSHGANRVPGVIPAPRASGWRRPVPRTTAPIDFVHSTRGHDTVHVRSIGALYSRDSLCGPPDIERAHASWSHLDALSAPWRGAVPITSGFHSFATRGQLVLARPKTAKSGRAKNVEW